MTESASARPRRRGAAIVGIVALLLAGGAGYVLWNRADAAAPPAAGAAKVPSVRVAVAPVARRDVPVVLDGLGTVQASQTINIHARVDGTLESVSFTEGQNVKAGDVLARLDPRLAQAALDQARAARTRDEAQLRSAEADLARFSELQQKDYASRQSVDQQQASVDQLKATLTADAAAIATAQTNLDYTVVTAPVNGRMGIRQLDAGNLVHTSDTTPIAVLTSLQPVSVIFSLPEKDLDDVQKAAARGSVAAVATRDDGTVLGTGTLAVIDNQIDASTATLKLKATFPNENERLWPGAFVHVRLSVDTMKGALTVPNAAVQRGQDGLFAWVIGSDDTASVRPIETAQVLDGFTVVTKGLEEGERVVVDGQYRLRAKARVTVRAAGGGEVADGNTRSGS
ncbi:efflux RND transporter periplasmic adaptor subunit [Ancylobacter lacus]|uniref:efflux RND transporter periplasmic adaptor subunit n=1 Tax=Ancylobacter lacus TaxID=2579970 RepID=UPI001BCECBC1|nr:efflux RND transporter periplasmic adaptor subunit [Ancylobacter lacus]MBS7541238.1 efflux RND transporter periplasmic adaptor subunit [Ancylobacter lacus]